MREASLQPKPAFRRLMRVLLGSFLLFLIASPGARAADDTELKRLQSLLGIINQELRASYEQYRMASEARAQALQTQMRDYLISPDIQNFEEVQERQREARRRDREMTDQMDRILANIRELEDRKKPILDRMSQELLRERAAPPAESAAPAEPGSPPTQPTSRPATSAPAGGY